MIKKGQVVYCIDNFLKTGITKEILSIDKSKEFSFIRLNGIDADGFWKVSYDGNYFLTKQEAINAVMVRIKERREYFTKQYWKNIKKLDDLEESLKNTENL